MEHLRHDPFHFSRNVSACLASQRRPTDENPFDTLRNIRRLHEQTVRFPHQALGPVPVDGMAKAFLGNNNAGPSVGVGGR
jgi:hypothetical protein